MTTTLRSEPTGSLALPVDVLERLSLSDGDTVRLAELGGIEVRVTTSPDVTELARQIEREISAAGVTMEELLASLADERERHTREKYGLPE